MRWPTPHNGAVRNSLPLAVPCETPSASPTPISCRAKSLNGWSVTLLCPVSGDFSVVKVLVWHAWQPTLENTWFPRVTEAPDAAEDGGCVVDAPAAAGMTLGTSAAAEATTIGVELEAA